MLFKVLPAAVLAAALGIVSAQAQSIREVSAPRELPPASYTGMQYVDSRGCVFVRAGVGGQTRWIPRVRNDRTVLCGYAPTFAAATPAPAPAPAPRTTGRAPVDTVASIATPPPRMAPAGAGPRLPAASYAPAPVAAIAAPAPAAAAPRAAAPAPAVRPAQTAEPRVARGTILPPGPRGCPSTAPIRERVALVDGGTAVLCLTRPGQLTARTVALTVPAAPAAAARPAAAATPVARPVSAAADRVACPSQAPDARRVALVDGGTAILCSGPGGRLTSLALPRSVAVASAPAPRPVVPTAAAPAPVRVAELPPPPPGYRLAWDDGRLNPARGQGTAAGQAAQDRVWTRTTPARLVAEPPRPARTARVTASTRSTPPATRAPAAAAAGRFVQVGTYGEPTNAAGAEGRLRALGLPVAQSQITRNGRRLQIVLAGPFADPAQAAAALAQVRRAGFTDAFPRQ